MKRAVSCTLVGLALVAGLTGCARNDAAGVDDTDPSLVQQTQLDDHELYYEKLKLPNHHILECIVADRYGAMSCNWPGKESSD